MGYAAIDETGNRYGEWEVLRRHGTSGSNATWWCRCSCGLEKAVRGVALRRGRSSKCRTCANRGIAGANRSDDPQDLRRWLVEGITSGPCTDCGRWPDHPCQMDLDHVFGEKKFMVNSTGIKGRSTDEILAEVAKCELVCASCHRLRTHERQVS